MRDSISPPCRASCKEVLGVLERFLSQPSLANLQFEVRENRRLIGLVIWLSSILSKSRIGLAFLLWFSAIVWSKKWFSRTRQKVYAVSLTLNNERALRHVSDEFRAAGVEFVVNSDRLPLSALWKRFSAYWLLSKELKGNLHTQPFIQLNQVLGITALVLFHYDLRVNTPRIVMAANDHSPPTVALYAAAKSLGIRSIYVQHGPVTSSFPPLSVDLAILHSDQAAKAYKSAAGTIENVPGKICIFPNNAEPIRPISAPRMPYTICLALSLYVDAEAIAKIASNLIKHENVSKVIITLHPRSALRNLNLESDSRVQILPIGARAKDIAQEVDICLVGNSGVALEFLQFGCPTFYLSHSDPSRDDYYNFVKLGVLTRFDFEMLNEPDRLLLPFAESWKTAMASFFPQLSRPHADFSKDLIDEISRLLDD